MLAHLVHAAVCVEPLGNGGVFASELFQVVFIIGIGQHANIKDVVCVNGNSTLEGERLKDQGQLCRWRKDERLDKALQLIGAQKTGVNDVRHFSKGAQDVALELDGLNEVSLWVVVAGSEFGQRVASSRLGIALYQGLGLAV